MADFFNAILAPLKLIVAYIMVAFHVALTKIGLPADSGWTWAFSIVGLVVVIRILLIPLFFKQIHAARGMQLLQPELRKLQEKYKGKTDPESRQKMTQETLELYREAGTNPFASCMPLLLQSPIFFALFSVLNGIRNRDTVGPLNATLVDQANSATLLQAKLSESFTNASTPATQYLTVVLIVLMSATTFITQRQLMMKNMPATALEGPFAQQQKIMLYLLPVIFALSGVNFPIGVLVYWLTTNLWSMGQQFYTIHRMPTPGSPAEKAYQERQRRKAARKGEVSPPAAASGNGTAATSGGDAASGGQRTQPRRQPKSKRSPGPGGSPGRPSSTARPPTPNSPVD